MILGDDPQKRERFVDEFQRLGGWSTLPQEEHANLRILFETADDESFPGAILPRPMSDGMQYYAVADTRRDWRSLSPLLKAFVGFTVTDFTGPASPLDADDSLEARLSDEAFAAIARFGARSDTRREVIARAGLVRLYECHRLSAHPRRSPPRSTRQVIDDFHMALAAADRQQAEEELEFLKSNMRLDAMNLRFLEAQLEETFGEWTALHAKLFFRELCYARRSPSVTAAMVKAVYYTKIQSIERELGPSAALERFRAEVLGQYGSLLTVCPPYPQLPVAKMFLLAAIGGEIIDTEAIEALSELKAGWSQDEVDCFDRFLTLIELPETYPDPAVDFSWAGLRRQLALLEVESEPATVERARAALLSAAAMETLDAYQIAVSYVNRLLPSDREALLSTPGYAGLWEDITHYASDDVVPRGWCEWLELLPKMSFAQAQACAERAAVEWPVTQYLQEPGDIESLIDALGEAQETEPQRVSHALPHLLLWAQSDPEWPNPNYIPLYEQLLLMLLVDERRSTRTLNALMTLLDGLLSLGLSKPDYEFIMDALRELAQHLDGKLYIDWLIDLAELTGTYSCPETFARSNLWAQIMATIGHFVSRLTGVQIAVLDELAMILGMPSVFSDLKQITADSPTSVSVGSLAGYSVAIYTLTESVGRRVARILMDLYPGMHVQLSHDRAAGERLKGMARNADLFVICWRSAKHAATDFIRQVRPRDKATIYAAGKGSSSILGAIDDHIQSVVL